MLSIEKLIGKLISEARKEKELNVRNLAKMAGWHETYQTHLEAGRKLPSVEGLVKLADVLKMDDLQRSELYFVYFQAKHKELNPIFKQLAKENNTWQAFRMHFLSNIRNTSSRLLSLLDQ